MKTKVEIVYKPDLSTIRNQPIFEARVPAGFPSPAADYQMVLGLFMNLMGQFVIRWKKIRL